MTTPAMKICDRCGGDGRIARVQRRRADGSPDPFDIVGQHREICDRCGGSGEIPKEAVVQEPRRGYAADIMVAGPAA